LPLLHGVFYEFSTLIHQIKTLFHQFCAQSPCLWVQFAFDFRAKSPDCSCYPEKQIFTHIKKLKK